MATAEQLNDLMVQRLADVLILGIYRYLWKLERLAEWEAEHGSGKRS